MSMFGDIKLETWNNSVGRFRSKLWLVTITVKYAHYKLNFGSDTSYCPTNWQSNSFESLAWKKIRHIHLVCCRQSRVDIAISSCEFHKYPTILSAVISSTYATSYRGRSHCDEIVHRWPWFPPQKGTIMWKVTGHNGHKPKRPQPKRPQT